MAGSPVLPPPPPIVAAIPVVPSYRRKPKRKTDAAPYFVATVTLVFCIVVGGVGFWVLTAKESIVPAPVKAKSVTAQQPPRPKAKPVPQKQADAAATARPFDDVQGPVPMAAPSVDDIDQAVARKLAEQAAERKKRLGELSQKERGEIPPLEEAVSSASQEIRDYQHKYERARTQLSGPVTDRTGRPVESSGIPQGTRVNPGPLSSREMQGIEGRGRERAANLLSQLDREYEHKMRELRGKREHAASRLEAKQGEIERLRQQILIGS